MEGIQDWVNKMYGGMMDDAQQKLALQRMNTATFVIREKLTGKKQIIVQGNNPELVIKGFEAFKKEVCGNANKRG